LSFYIFLTANKTSKWVFQKLIFTSLKIYKNFSLSNKLIRGEEDHPSPTNKTTTTTTTKNTYFSSSPSKYMVKANK
jgi:hypothetical protein